AGDRYLWDHLIEHLIGAGRDAGTVACDLRWAGARLLQFGPAAPTADLVAVGTPRSTRLAAILTQVAHLLGSATPGRSVIAVLHSRVAADPDWGPQATALRSECPWPRLVSRIPPPDLPHPSLRRVLAGHDGAVTVIAVAPDGSWLATGSKDQTVRIWN